MFRISEKPVRHPLRPPALLAVLLLLGCRPGPKIPDLTGVRIVVRQVAGPLYMLEATGDVAGNVAALIGEGEALLVDSQFAPLASGIRKALRDLGVSRIRYLINTHHHDDHTHGNSELASDAMIYSREKTRARLLDTGAEHLPDITFSGEASLYFAGETIRMIPFPPGHTDNDLVVVFTRSGVWHLGDLWNSGISSFPTVDLEAGGSVEGMLHDVERLLDIIPPGARIIPGHYVLSDPEDLKRTRDMLKETIGLVRNKIKAGQNLKQIQAAGLPEKYADWGTAYADAETWIENIYSGLMAVADGR